MSAAPPEYATDHVGQDGALSTKVRPICFLEVPPGIALDARRKLVRELNAALSEDAMAKRRAPCPD